MGLVLWVGPAMAGEDVESELAEMRHLMQGLEQKVNAQEEQLNEQSRNLEEAQRVVRRTQADAEAVSGLSSFLNSLEVDGHVAISYAYNVINSPNNSAGATPGGGNNQLTAGLDGGSSGNFLPYHSDHDSFKIDQIWFGLGKPATEESRAGFRFDLLYGATAVTLGQRSPAFSRASTSDETNDYYINQAYIEYLAPVMDGVMVKAGKFGTLAGAEVAKTTENFNITRGNLFTLLQPIDHIGALVATDLGPVNVTVGALNSSQIGVGTVDDNSEKTLITSLTVGDDAFSGAATVLWGAESGSNNDRIGLLDLLLSANPSDDLSLYVNFDYLWSEGNANGPLNNGHAWGLSVAGRMALSEKLGVSLRGEYVADNSGRLGLRQGNNASAGRKDDNNVWGLTATVDYTLVEDLLLRLESRYDRVNASGEFFNRSGLDRDQWVLLAEAVYTF
jgi:hypothetical protein